MYGQPLRLHLYICNIYQGFPMWWKWKGIYKGGKPCKMILSSIYTKLRPEWNTSWSTYVWENIYGGDWVWLKLSYNHTGSIQFSIQVATKLVNYYDPYQVQALIGKLALQAQVGKDPWCISCVSIEILSWYLTLWLLIFHPTPASILDKRVVKYWRYNYFNL